MANFFNSQPIWTDLIKKCPISINLSIFCGSVDQIKSKMGLKIQIFTIKKFFFLLLLFFLLVLLVLLGCWLGRWFTSSGSYDNCGWWIESEYAPADSLSAISVDGVAALATVENRSTKPRGNRSRAAGSEHLKTLWL